MISVVIPVRNEAMCIKPLVSELISVMKSVNVPYEIIFINDHSTDTTTTILEETSEEHPEVNVTSLDNAYGKDAGLVKGMLSSQGNILITLDGDLQNDPSDIPRLLPLIDTFDMVCGVRNQRNDPVLKKMASRIANQFRRGVAGGSITDAGCALRCMKRSCIPIITRYNSTLFGSAHYFYPDLVEAHGGRITEVSVKHRPRRFGTTKFNLMSGRVVSGIRACVAVRRIRKLMISIR